MCHDLVWFNRIIANASINSAFFIEVYPLDAFFFALLFQLELQSLKLRSVDAASGAATLAGASAFGAGSAFGAASFLGAAAAFAPLASISLIWISVRY